MALTSGTKGPPNAGRLAGLGAGWDRRVWLAVTSAVFIVIALQLVVAEGHDWYGHWALDYQLYMEVTRRWLASDDRQARHRQPGEVGRGGRRARDALRLAGGLRDAQAVGVPVRPAGRSVARLVAGAGPARRRVTAVRRDVGHVAHDAAQRPGRRPPLLDPGGAAHGPAAHRLGGAPKNSGWTSRAVTA